MSNTPMPSDSSALKGALLGAFIGSIVTFLFVLLRDFIRSVRERRTTHLNSLVKLETELTLDGQTVHENLEIVPDFIKSLEKPAPYLHPLKTIAINTSHFQDLHNLEIKNELLTYQIHMNKLNQDIADIQKSYDELKTNLLSGGDKQAAAFKGNAPVFIEWLKQIKIAIELQLAELDHLAAVVRLHLIKDPSWLRKQKTKLLKNPPLTDEEISEEIKKLQAERAASAQDDSKRVSKIRGTKNS